MMRNLGTFNPNPQLMKKVYWANRYSNRIMKLHDVVHKSFMNEAENWGSPEHLKLQRLTRRISFRITFSPDIVHY